MLHEPWRYGTSVMLFLPRSALLLPSLSDTLTLMTL